MKSDLIELDENYVKEKVYEIRNKKVMLDYDLAKIYGYETRYFNRQVKNNIERFNDEDFMFQLTKEEFQNLMCKKFTSSWGGIRKLPYAFTEQGIYMLATVLKGELAVKQSKALIKIFKKMKDFIFENDYFLNQKFINNLVIEHDNDIKILKNIYNKFETKELLLLNGQTYDAYSKILDILKLAKEELIIIDNYADNKVLNMISKLKVNIMLITKDSKRLNELDIEKYNSQYKNLKVIRNNTFHDRYIIIDKKEVYHLGTSINNAGNGIFSINKLEDKFVINTLLDKVGGFKYE